MKTGEDLQEQIIDALKDVPSGLTSRRIHALTNSVGIQEVASCLRHLRNSGHVQLTGGTVWQWTGKTYIAPAPSRPEEGENVEETRQFNSSNRSDLPQHATKLEIPQNTRWDEFRRLCLYYAECIRLEDRAKVQSYAEKEGQGFICLSGPLNLRTVALGGILRIEIKEEWATFLRTLHQPKGNPRFYIGYPVHVYVFRDKANGDTKQGLFPIFVQQMECHVHQDTIEIKAANPIEVNSDWLEGRFKRNAEDRQAFLEQMGLYLSIEGERQYQQLDFQGLSELLRVYYPDEFREYPNVSKLDHTPSLHEIEESGHYNRAVLISQQKLKYSERLHSELLKLARKEDQELDCSALKYLFHHTPPSAFNNQISTSQEAEISSPLLPGLAEYEPMDEKQREACHQAMSAPVTIINGPPGTGKSRVVAQIMTNAALTGQTALFASKNHQAIEAVVPRLNGLVEPDMLIISTARKFGSDDYMIPRCSMCRQIHTQDPSAAE